MKRVVIPTLEEAGSRGGIQRYIDAIVLTFPNVRVEHITKPSYEFIFPIFWKSHQETDLYLIHEVLPVGTVAWLTKMTGSRPYVIFLHGMDFDLARRNPWKRWLTKQILKGAEAIVVNSEQLKKELSEGRYTDRPVHVIYPPVNDGFVEASKGTRKGKGWTDLRDLAKLAAGSLGLSVSMQKTVETAKPIVLLTVARLVERKGHLKVLDAMTKLPNTTYTIVGDGPMKETILAKVKELGLADRVKLISDVDDAALPDIYADADIFVMPTTQSASDREGFGIVYLEANLFGLPVVGTKGGGVREAIVDGKTGVVIEDNVEDLVKALQVLIDSPELRASMGSRGRVRVLEQFTREEQMRKLNAILL